MIDLHYSRIHRIFVACLLLSGLLAGSSLAHEAGKLGVVDIEKVFNAYYKTGEVEKLLRNERAKAKTEYDNLLAEYKQQMEDSQEASSALMKGKLVGEELKAAESKAKAAGWKLKQLEKGLEDFKQRREQLLKDMETRMRKSIHADIQAVLKDQAKALGLSLVYDSSGLNTNRIPPILYADDPTDLSDQIIKALNASAPAR